MLAATAGLAAPATARMTHTVSIEGQLTDNWSIDDPRECGAVGSGTLTVGFKSTQKRAVLPRIERFQRGEGGRYGAWTVWVPLGRNLKHMPFLRSAGTITRVDNTTKRPLAGGEPCKPADKSGCGARPLAKSFTGFRQYGRRHLTVQLSTQPFEYDSGECLSGDVGRWSHYALAGGAKSTGDLVFRMPKPSVLKRKRVVRLTGSAHRRTVLKDPYVDDAATLINDVTRRVTVTFRRR